jgi:hypothetical protein
MRRFGTSAAASKVIRWTLRGCTQDVTWVQAHGDDGVDEVPGLREKAVQGTIQFV